MASSGALADSLKDCREEQNTELQARGCPEYFRALSYMKSEQYELARSDLDHAINVNPQLYQAYLTRANLERFYKQYQNVREDLTQAINILQPYSTNSTVRDYIRSLQDEVQANDDYRLREEHWVEYLKAIQNDRDCQNWSALPYNLYRVNAARNKKALPANAEPLSENAELQPCNFSPAPKPADSPQPEDTKDHLARPRRQPPRPILAVVLVGVIVVIVLFSTVVFSRRFR